jgi:DNA replication initiation complex subunit (GINS family)
MYDELFNAWQYEIENDELGCLNSDFFSNLSNYFANLKEKNSDKSQKTVKSSLLLHEMEHVTCMIEELTYTRYLKIIKITKNEQELPLTKLSSEEKKIFSNFLSFIKEYQLFKR